jgi:hypothetical protein
MKELVPPRTNLPHFEVHESCLQRPRGFMGSSRKRTSLSPSPPCNIPRPSAQMKLLRLLCLDHLSRPSPRTKCRVQVKKARFLRQVLNKEASHNGHNQLLRPTPTVPNRQRPQALQGSTSRSKTYRGKLYRIYGIPMLS